MRVTTIAAAEYCNNVTDGTHDSPKPKATGFKLITSKHLKRYEIDFKNANYISEDDYKKVIERSRVEQWDILISMIGTIGNLYIETNSVVRYACKNIGIFQLGKDEMKSKWLYYYLQSPKALEYISSVSRGTTQGYVPLGALRNMPIDVVDDSVRNKIVTLLWSLDERIKINIAINNNLEQQAQAIFKSWFIDFEPFDGHKPSNWKFSILGEVSQMGAGGDKPQIVSPSKTEDCPYPIYSNGLSNEGLYGYTNYAKIFEESVTVSARGTIGFVSLRHIPYVPIVRLVTLIPKKEILSAKYLFFWLKQLHITGTGTTQQQLTVPAFQKTEILVPSLESIASFDEIVDPIYQKIWSNQSENEHLAAMRDALLPKLMSGELDVSDIEL